MEFTSSNNLPLLSQGDLGQYWGVRGLNRFLSLVDQSLDSVHELAFSFDPLTENVDTIKLETLTPKNGVSDSARPRIMRNWPVLDQVKTLRLKIPNRAKFYIVNIPQGFNLIVETENGSSRKIFCTSKSPFFYGPGRFIFHTDGVNIYAVNRKVPTRIRRWNNTDVNVEGQRFITAQPEDNGVIFIPLNANVTTLPALRFLSISNYPDGFTASIQRGPVARIEASTLNPAFGTATNAGGSNFRAMSFTASRNYDRWATAFELMPGEN